MVTYSMQIPRWYAALILVFAIVFWYIWLTSAYETKSMQFVLVGILLFVITMAIALYILVTGRQPWKFVQNK